MLWPATSKSISTKSHLVILAAPTGQGGHGAFDCVWGRLQSVTGSHLASGCPFTACGPRHINHSVSRVPLPPAPSILYLPQGASSSSVWFFYSFLPAQAPSPQALSGRSLFCNSLHTCIPLSQMLPLSTCLITPNSAGADPTCCIHLCVCKFSHGGSQAKSTRTGSDSPVHRPERTPGSKYSSTSGLSPRGHLERQAEFHASTQDEA